MNDAEKLRRYERAYVAWMLGIPGEVLDRYPYRIVDHRVGASCPVWRIIWIRSPPRGVEAQRASYAAWTDIPSLFDSGET